MFPGRVADELRGQPSIPYYLQRDSNKLHSILLSSLLSGAKQRSLFFDLLLFILFFFSFRRGCMEALRTVWEKFSYIGFYGKRSTILHRSHILSNLLQVILTPSLTEHNGCFHHIMDLIRILHLVQYSPNWTQTIFRPSLTL